MPCSKLKAPFLAGASFHTYGSADSGRSGTGNDEDAAASASELLEILQISDTLNPSAASARMKTLSTPPVSLAPYENARRPSSMAELPKQVDADLCPKQFIFFLETVAI